MTSMIPPSLAIAPLADRLERLTLMNGSSPVEVHLRPSRSLAALIRLANGRYIFTKKLLKTSPYGEGALENHIRAGHTDAAVLACRPAFLGSIDGWQFSEGIPDARPLRDYLHQDSGFQQNTGRRLGETIAGIQTAQKTTHAAHTHTDNTDTGTNTMPISPAQTHIKPLSLMNPQDYALLPGTDRDLYAAAAQKCAPGIRVLQSSLRQTCLVHGDLNAGNILLTGTSDRETLHLVDWDRCGMGDPAWDLGHIIAAALIAWSNGVHTGHDTSLDAALATAERPWPRYADWLASVWAGYKQSMTNTATASACDDTAWRTAGYALLQKGFNRLSQTGVLGLKGRLILSMAETLTNQPADARHALMPAPNTIQ